MYDASTNQPFRMRGLGFPNCGDDVNDWIAVLERIRSLSSNINVVRLYELPSCISDSGASCMEPFMRKADDLGVYVLVPGTGTLWGFLPNDPAFFHNDANEAYKSGGVLGFGQTMVQKFNYPNTLAIVIGNEFDQKPSMRPYMGVLKAYARDLKSYLSVCNSDNDSPTKGQMRQIPLAYACSDDSGDPGVQPKADYLMCASSSDSIDMFGLNIERWCDDSAGPGQYQTVNDWVAQKSYPGSFFLSEMGCAKNFEYYHGTRSWAQVPDFFSNFGAIDGFAAYTYAGNKDFDMFDGVTAAATELPDGTNFFTKMATIGSEPTPVQSDGNLPSCPSDILGSAIVDYTTINWYDTGDTQHPSQCPPPYGSSSRAAAIDTSILA